MLVGTMLVGGLGVRIGQVVLFLPGTTTSGSIPIIHFSLSLSLSLFFSIHIHIYIYIYIYTTLYLSTVVSPLPGTATSGSTPEERERARSWTCWVEQQFWEVLVPRKPFSHRWCIYIYIYIYHRWWFSSCTCPRRRASTST